MDKQRLKKLILPVSLTLLVMLITYFGNQIYAEYNGVVGTDYSYIFFDFNMRVPFLSWTIYPYVIAYPFWFFGFIYIGYRSEKALYVITTVALISFLICGVWYFFWQSDVEAWRVTSGLFIDNNYDMPRTDLNFTEQLVMNIYKAAGPRNALPSMHTINSWLVILGLRIDKKIPLIIKILMVVLSLSIIIATQTLKQHYIIDLIVGLIIAEGLYWVVIKLHWDQWVKQQFYKLNYQWGIIKKNKIRQV